MRTWDRRTRSAADRRATPPPASPRSAGGPASSARSRPTSSATFTATTSRRGRRVHHAAADVGRPTARSMILVTPDGHRTMNTFLGAAQHLPTSALDEEQIRDPAILYLEGYLWDPETPRYAMVRAIEVAREAGRKVAFTLSDTFCVDRHRDGFNRADRRRADRHPVRQPGRDRGACRRRRTSRPRSRQSRPRSRPWSSPAARTARWRSAAASAPMFPPSRSAKLVDTTGAGDLFAAGFLFGDARGQEPRTVAAARRDLRRRGHPALRRAPRGGPQGARRRTRSLSRAFLRRHRRAGQRRDADRTGRVGESSGTLDDSRGRRGCGCANSRSRSAGRRAPDGSTAIAIGGSLT